MKPGLSLLGAIVSLFLLVVLGCNKNPVTLSEESIKQPTYKVELSVTVENTSNPYDSVGYWHNQIVEFIAVNNEISHSTTQTELVTYMWVAMDELSAPGASHEDSLEIMEIVNEVLSSGYESSAAMAEAVSSWCDSCDVSVVKSYLDSLSQIITSDSLIGVDTVYSTVGQIDTFCQSFVDRVKSVEAQILMDDRIEANSYDEIVLLSYTAVLRYSFVYWVSELLHSDSPWNSVFPTNKSGSWIGDAWNYVKSHIPGWASEDAEYAAAAAAHPFACCFGGFPSPLIFSTAALGSIDEVLD